jgi:hypothetical protein
MISILKYNLFSCPFYLWCEQDVILPFFSYLLTSYSLSLLGTAEDFTAERDQLQECQEQRYEENSYNLLRLITG